MFNMDSPFGYRFWAIVCLVIIFFMFLLWPKPKGNTYGDNAKAIFTDRTGIPSLDATPPPPKLAPYGAFRPQN